MQPGALPPRSRCGREETVARTVIAVCALVAVFSCCFGATASPSDAAAALDALVRDKEYPELERKLSGAQLPHGEHDYFMGVLANRQNRVAESIALLEKATPKLGDPGRIEIGLETLADDYQRVFRYADAARVLSDALHRHAEQIDASRRKDVENSLRF